MRTGGEFKIYFLSPEGFESFQSDLPQARWRNLVSVVVGFCFMGIDANLSDKGWELITLAQFHGSEMSPGFFQ